MLENKMSLSLGDWSEDGYEKSKDFIFMSNKTIEEVIEGYKKSTKSLGFSFNINGTSWDKTTLKVCCEYQNCRLDHRIVEIAAENEYILDKGYEGIPEEYEYAFDDESFLDFWFWFVEFSIPDLKYEFVTPGQIDNINDHLNVNFGYGLYE